MILSVKKAMDILDCIDQKGRMSLKDLSNQLGMPKSTACQLAQTLEACGYLQQDSGTGDYFLSYKFFRIGYDILEKLGIRECVLPVIEKLSKETQETINLSVLDEAKALYIEKIETSLIHTGIKVGSHAPLHCTASGKAMLASLPREKISDVLEKCVPFEVFTEKTIVTVEDLLNELEVCRDQGYALCKDEIAKGVYAVGAVIHGYPGREAAALSIAGPSNRFTPERMSELIDLILEACEAISRKFKA